MLHMGWKTMMTGQRGGGVEVRRCEDEDEETFVRPRCTRRMAGGLSESDGGLADFW